MDILKLEYEMKKKGISPQELCESIGMSRSSFYRKCKGITEFTQGDIEKIIDYLELSSPMGIFFKDQVSYMTQERR